MTEVKKERRIFKFLKIFFLLSLFAIIILVVLVFSFYSYYSKKIPKIPYFDEIEFSGVSVIRSNEGIVLGEVYEEKRYIVPVSEIPPLLIKAFLASEDKRFFEHKGLDIMGILRAAWSNLIAGEIREGGSTITQQIAKIFVGKEKTLSRKIKEAILARRIEEAYTKEQILHLYMNLIYLGHNSYGVKSAAKNYFRKKLKDLSLSEIAIIASLPQAPSRINPYVNINEAKREMKRVLERMNENGFITEQEMKAALNEKITVYPLLDNFGDKAPAVSQKAKEEVLKILGIEKNEGEILGKKILSCELGVDLSLQLSAEEALYNGLLKLQKRQGYKKALAKLEKHDFEKFLKRAEKFYKAKNGEQFLKENEFYLGLITGVEPKELKVKISNNIEGKIPYKYLKWVHKYTEFPRFDYIISKENGIFYYEVRNEEGKTIKKKNKFKDGIGGIALRDVENIAEGEKLLFHRWKEKKNVSLDGKLSDARKFFQYGDVVLVKLMKNEKERIFSLEVQPEIEGGVLSVEPHTEYIKVMVGSSDYDKNKVNYTESLRQTGSAIKPVYYAMIYNMGVPPSKIFSGAPFREEKYEPTVGKDLEDLTLWHALSQSENSISLRVMKYILNNAGKDEYIEWMKKFNLHRTANGYIAEALGIDETLFNMVNAYSIFANNGFKNTPVLLKYVEDSDGNIIFDKRSVCDANLKVADNLKVIYDSIFEQKERIISKEVGFLISSNLREVVETGTGVGAKKLNAPLHGKTGTMPYDVWFIGYNSDIVAGVWMGEDLRKRFLGKNREKSGVYGSNSALLVWVDFLKSALFEREIVDNLKEVPENIVFAEIDPKTGLLSRGEGIKIPHLKGTEPFEYPPEIDGVEFVNVSEMEF